MKLAVARDIPEFFTKSLGKNTKGRKATNKNKKRRGPRFSCTLLKKGCTEKRLPTAAK
jgi:hypothetical protein